MYRNADPLETPDLTTTPPISGTEELASGHRVLAPRAFNHTWKLLDETELTPEQEEECYASRFAQDHAELNPGISFAMARQKLIGSGLSPISPFCSN